MEEDSAGCLIGKRNLRQVRHAPASSRRFGGAGGWSDGRCQMDARSRCYGASSSSGPRTEVRHQEECPTRKPRGPRTSSLRSLPTIADFVARGQGSDPTARAVRLSIRLIALAPVDRRSVEPKIEEVCSMSVWTKWLCDCMSWPSTNRALLSTTKKGVGHNRRSPIRRNPVLPPIGVALPTGATTGTDCSLPS